MGENKMDELEIQNLMCRHLKICIEEKHDKTLETDKLVVSLYYDDYLIDSDWVYAPQQKCERR